jgi:hypothetical protein
MCYLESVRSAPDLSRAVDLAFIEIVAKPRAYKRYRGPSQVHGAAQIRRELVMKQSRPWRAEFFAPPILGTADDGAWNLVASIRSLPRRRLGEGGSIRGLFLVRWPANGVAAATL